MSRAASVVLLGLLITAVSAGPASAEKRQSRAIREKAAKKACALGDYQKGEDILADLFVETDDPTYVFNQGRCYQQNNRWEQAIGRFREFLRKAERMSAAERANAEKQIADCEGWLAKAPAPVPPPVVEAPPASSRPAEAPPLVSQPMLVTSSDTRSSTTTTEEDSSAGRTWRVTGVVLASVGVVAIAASIACAIKANSLSSADYSRSREDERSSLKTWGMVGYSVGAASIATGVAFYVVGWPKKKSSGLAVLPAFAPGEASLLLRGSY
jgi:tetratricopeptide (TPR) repeat protein